MEEIRKLGGLQHYTCAKPEETPLFLCNGESDFEWLSWFSLSKTTKELPFFLVFDLFGPKVGEFGCLDMVKLFGSKANEEPYPFLGSQPAYSFVDFQMFIKCSLTLS